MSIISKFLSLSLPWRLSLSILMMFLAGPALIGFLSEYATYWYAINHNVRPPVEGIPYLSATVTFGSLLLALLVSITFALTRLIIGYFVGSVVTSFEGYAKLPSLVVNFFKKFFTFNTNSIDKVFEQIGNTPNEIRGITAKSIVVFAALGGGIIFGLAYWQSSGQGNEQALKYSVFISGYFVIILLTLWRKFIMQVVAFIAAISFYIFSISLLFNQQYYSQFLNLTGFGGGQPIAIQTKSEATPVNMKLILRSKDWFIGHSTETGESIEIPKSVVKNITYKKVSAVAH
jgi:hypothetical protein